MAPALNMGFAALVFGVNIGKPRAAYGLSGCHLIRSERADDTER